MKKLPKTLDEVWRECLRMWKWIAEQVQGGRLDSVANLKAEWLEANEYGFGKMANDCFFCEWSRNGDCDDCPARIIDKKFLCAISEYDYESHPLLFYQKLVELNEIRIKRQKQALTVERK